MNSQKIKRNLKVGKIEFNAATQEQLLTIIEQLSTDEYSPYVTFTGMQIVVGAEKSSKIKKAQDNATICAVDGMPIHWMAKMKKIESERCGGPDIMDKIIEIGVSKGYRHFFYGSTDEVLGLLKVRLEKKYPGIQIVGMYSPPFRPLTEEEDEQVVKMINEANADFVWVGLGAPKQDFWMEEHQYKLKDTKMMGVGAAFNFFAGTVKRAPIFMQKIGMEWLYRLIMEPKYLWKRYILNGPKFFLIFIKELIQ